MKTFSRFLLAGFLLLTTPAVAQTTSDVCYLVADNDGIGGDDVLLALDRQTGQETVLGTTSSFFIEAIAHSPYEHLLLATNGGALGEIDLNTGRFLSKGVIGRGTGVFGEIYFDDVDGLAFDPTTATLFGTVRADPYNLLIQINPATGQAVKHAFDLSNDYAVLDVGEQGVFVDDIAINGETGDAYLVANSEEGGSLLYHVNLVTGQTSFLSTLDVGNVEGLSFFPGRGLVGSLGDSGDALLAISPFSGRTETIATLGLDGNRDYESVSCMTDATTPRPAFIPSFTFEPGEISLLQNAPNPAITYTDIPIQLSKTLTVGITVFDLTGREVANVPERQYGPGVHFARVDTRELAPGVYFYRASSRIESEALKLVVVR